MAEFDFALPVTLDHEGGISDIPEDHGGLTNLGLTRATIAEYYGRPVTDEEIRGCTEELAAKIYKTLYWDRQNLDRVNSQLIALCMFDQAVLAGVIFSSKTAQACLDVTIDGVVGSRTVAALNACDPKVFITAFLTACKNHFVAIAKAHGNQRIFLSGWINRLNSLAEMAGLPPLTL